MNANDHELAEARNTMLAAGGVALMVMGAGLLMTHPFVRRTVMASLGPVLPQLEGPVKEKLSHVLPDLERYLKLRAM
jgi:hypothetical protein